MMMTKTRRHPKKSDDDVSSFSFPSFPPSTTFSSFSRHYASSSVDCHYRCCYRTSSFFHYSAWMMIGYDYDGDHDASLSCQHPFWIFHDRGPLSSLIAIFSDDIFPRLGHHRKERYDDDDDDDAPALDRDGNGGVLVSDIVPLVLYLS
jgi:hypothetical protein